MLVGSQGEGEGEGYVRELFQVVGVVVEGGGRKEGMEGWWMVVLLGKEVVGKR